MHTRSEIVGLTRAVISRLHAAAHDDESSQNFDDVTLLESSAALARKTRTMLEMISAVDQIGVSENYRRFRTSYESALDEWRKAYVSQVKATDGPTTFADEFCNWLRQDSKATGHDDTSHLDSFIQTLTKMADTGGVWSYLQLRRDTKQPREAYLRGKSSEAPELIMWDKHAEYANDIRAHMEGLRRTYVSILTDFRSLAEKRPMTIATSAMLSKPWDDMEGRIETFKDYGAGRYEQEEARILNVPLHMLNRPIVKDADSPWDALELSTSGGLDET